MGKQACAVQLAAVFSVPHLKTAETIGAAVVGRRRRLPLLNSEISESRRQMVRAKFQVCKHAKAADTSTVEVHLTAQLPLQGHILMHLDPETASTLALGKSFFVDFSEAEDMKA
jgi:hypothetical protein